MSMETHTYSTWLGQVAVRFVSVGWPWQPIGPQAGRPCEDTSFSSKSISGHLDLLTWCLHSSGSVKIDTLSLLSLNSQVASLVPCWVDTLVKCKDMKENQRHEEVVYVIMLFSSWCYWDFCPQQDKLVISPTEKTLVIRREHGVWCCSFNPWLKTMVIWIQASSTLDAIGCLDEIPGLLLWSLRCTDILFSSPALGKCPCIVRVHLNGQRYWFSFLPFLKAPCLPSAEQTWGKW